jgi:hypothetical protein
LYDFLIDTSRLPESMKPHVEALKQAMRAVQSSK